MVPAIVGAYKGLSLAWRIGVIAAIVASVMGSYAAAYFSGKSEGKKEIRAEWDNSIAQAAANAVQESVKASTMTSEKVKVDNQEDRVIEAKAEHVTKKVVHHARKDPKPLSAVTIALYNELISLPNEAGRSLPPADSGTREPEVQRGGLAVETVTRIQDEDGNTIELTTEELAQAVSDFSKKFAKMKSKYANFSGWNDGREKIELERISE